MEEDERKAEKEWESNATLHTCDYCSELKKCQFVVDPYCDELGGSSEQLTPKWMCLICYEIALSEI